MKFSICYLLLSILFSFQIIPKNKEFPSKSTAIHPALVVLENKCNNCHIKRKRAIFTEQNMVQNAPKIYEQVFVKERMPKGKKNQLTAEETLILKDWLVEMGIDFSKK